MNKNSKLVIPSPNVLARTTKTIMMARQTAGKTTIIRRWREKADAAGEPFPIINLESNKPGITRFIKSYVDTLPVTATSPEDMHEFFFETVQKYVDEGHPHVVVDTNGEDERLLSLCRKYPLGEIFADMNVKSQLFFIGSADAQDLEFLRLIDESRAFYDAPTILAFALHSCKGTNSAKSFSAFTEAPIIKKIKERSEHNRVVLIPAFTELQQVQHLTIPLHDIGRLGGMNKGQDFIASHIRTRIRGFCTALDEAFVGIKEMIP